MSPLDDAEFSAFMSGRYTALLRTATLLMGDRALGEDLLQNALFTTARRWRWLRDKGAAEGYTRAVMVREAGHSRRRRWWGERPTAVVPESPVPDASHGVDLADALARELALLPYEQRAVLVLRYYEQLTEAEIAAALGCSTGTVKSQAARALTRLRAELCTERTEGAR